MAGYVSDDGMFVVPAGRRDDLALAEAMHREAEFWAGWTEQDEAAFQADMKRILAKYRKVGPAPLVTSFPTISVAREA